MPRTTRLSTILTQQQDVEPVVIPAIPVLEIPEESKIPEEPKIPSWAIIPEESRLKPTTSRINRFHFPVINEANLTMFDVVIHDLYGGGIEVLNKTTQEVIPMTEFLTQLNRVYKTETLCVIFCQRNFNNPYGSDINQFQVVERYYMPIFKQSWKDCGARISKHGLLKMGGYQMLNIDINWFNY